MTDASLVRESSVIPGSRLEYHRRPALTDSRREPLILLHPWFGCWQGWRRTVDALPEFETFAVDLYSLGVGSGWHDFASPQGLAQAVGMMMDALRIEHCSLIGNSMGGIAGQALAAARADRVDKLILVGTGARTIGVKPDYRKTMEEWIASKEDRASAERLVAALIARRPDDPDAFATYVDMVMNANKAFMGTVLMNAFALDLRPLLPEITAATLVIRGELDVARTRVHVEELLAGIQNSKSAELSGAGHSPQVDSPHAFSGLVRDFLLA
jgi:3-oxoadipate enol-lactonase